MSSVDEIMASLLNSPSKSKSQNGVVKVKYNASNRKQENIPVQVQTRQGRSQARNTMVPPSLKPSSLASQIMASRASSTPPSPANQATSVIQETPTKMVGSRGKQFSDIQKKRLTEELSKNPDMTPYFKKKVASNIAKEIGLGEKQIINWFTTNQRKSGFEKSVASPVQSIVAASPVKSTPVIIKKENPDSFPTNRSTKPRLTESSNIECIEIDDDDDMLLSDSVLDESVTLVESKLVTEKQTSNEKKATHEESSKDEIVHLLMDQIKELEKFVQTNSSPELEKFKKLMKEKTIEVEQLRSDMKSKNENLQVMVRTSEDQEQRLTIEIKALKEEITNSSRKPIEDSNVKVFKQRISELEKTVKSKDEDHYILKNKLDLVENVSNNKVKMYKEKLEETEKSKSSEDNDLRNKFESLQKDYSEKVDVVKSLESRIPKMIEEFTKYVEEKDSIHITKEKEFAKSNSDKQKEIEDANQKLESFGTISNSIAEKSQEVNMLKQREKEVEERLEKKQVELMNTIEKKEKENLEARESHRKLRKGLDHKEKELQVSVKEMQDKSKEFELFKQTQMGLNEKYKKLLLSKDKELDQAEKDSLELREKIKKFKEENKLKRTLDSKEIVEIKESKKKLKKENELKDKEIELKSKQLGKLEVNLKDTTEKISKLQEKNKALEKIITKNDSNFQKQKTELATKTDEVTSLQITSQKLTKLNNEMKHQYNELNKIYNKALVDMKKNEKMVVDKTEELSSIQKAATAEKEIVGAEIKLMKEDSISKEEKINKLLDVLVKRGDHIRELKSQDADMTKKLKQKEEQYIDLVGRYSKKVKGKDMEIEVKSKELSRVESALETKEVEVLENNGTIIQLRNTLANCENRLKEDSAKFMVLMKTKERELLDKSYSLKKEMQKMILDCNEKLDSKDQLLREKALEHGRKLAERTTELGEKVKEKELLLLNLNAMLFEKDNIIGERDNVLKMTSGRMLELKKGFEKQLEDRVFTDINTQNNIRHELLIQQQQMKKVLVEEHEILKKQIIKERDEALKQFDEERASIKKQIDLVTVDLVSKIKQKRDLVKKLKTVHLYKTCENVGQEKTKASISSPLMIRYSWPLVHLFGSPDLVEENRCFFFINDELAEMLLLRFTSLKNNLPLLKEQSRTEKRKFAEEDFEIPSSKRIRIAPTMLMLTYSWPLVSCEPHPNTIFLLNDSGASLLNMRLRVVSLKDPRMPSLAVCNHETNSSKRKFVDEDEDVVSKKPRTTPKLLMLTYSWPLVACGRSSEAAFLLNDIGVIVFNLRLRLVTFKDKIMPTFTVGHQEKRKTVVEKPSPATNLRMLTYSWPLVTCEQKPNAAFVLNDDGSALLRLGFLSLKDKRLSGFNLVEQHHRTIKRKIEEFEEAPSVTTKRLRVEDVSAAASPLMLTYSWPVVQYKTRATNMVIPLFGSGNNLISNLGHGVKRKIFSGSEFETGTKKLRRKDPLEEVSSFYSYKSSKQVVKSTCMSSPGLCSPKKSVSRTVVLPKDLEELLDNDYESSDEEFEESNFSTPILTRTKCLSSPGLCPAFPKVTARTLPLSVEKLIDGEEEELDYFDIELEENGNSVFDTELRFSTPKPKKTKCLSSPGLCDTTPVVTRRSFPALLNGFVEEVVIESDDEDAYEISFRTPNPTTKTKCTRTPGLCETFPKVTIRSLPPYLSECEGLTPDDSNPEDMLALNSDDEVSFEEDSSTFTTQNSEDSVKKLVGHGGLAVAAVIEETIENVVTLGEIIVDKVVEEAIESVVSLGKLVAVDLMGEIVEQVVAGEPVELVKILTVVNRPQLQIC